jgi:hypothetical protein
MREIRLAKDDLEAMCGITIDDGLLPVYVLAKVSEYLYAVDASHPECPLAMEPAIAPAVGNPSGAGTELKKLLARFGIATAPGCACNARAAEMDMNGIDWCASNVDAIVSWLREQANARGLPFLNAAGRLLVRRAIRNARKASA